MASHTYNLDETRLVCSNSNFKLKTTCSMKLISPHGHFFPFSFIFQSLDLIASSGIWVAGCNKIEFSVQVSGIDFFSLQFDQNALAESLRNIICETEIWATLGLKASCQSSFIHANSFDSAMDPLIFSLSPCTYAETEHRVSRTALSFSSHPAEPPRGIPYALIEQIGLTLEFSRGEAQDMESGVRIEQELLETLFTQNKGVPKLYEIPDLVKSSAQHYEINDGLELCRDMEEIQDVEPLGLSENDTNKIPSWGDYSGDISPHRSNDKRQSVCLEAKGISLNSNTGKFDSTHILRLASAGMRSIFCNVDSERASGVQLSNETARLKLCDVSPALFSPGYSRVLSYHNSFLGHIARISTTISRRIQARRIKDKFDDLKRFSPEEFVGYDLPSESIVAAAPMDLAKAFQIRIWKVLQMKLREPKHRSHVAAEMLRRRNRTDNHLDWSLVGSVMVRPDENLATGNDSSSQGWFFENLNDEMHKEVFEDDVGGGFAIEDYEPIQHDAFDDLLYNENLAMGAPNYLGHSKSEPNTCLDSASGVIPPNPFVKCTHKYFREPVKYSADSRSSSVCDGPEDELWDILDKELHVDADELLLNDFTGNEGDESSLNDFPGDEGDESLLDDFPSDQDDESLLDDLPNYGGSQSLDLLTEHGAYEMMMDE